MEKSRYVLKWNFSILENDKLYTHSKCFTDLTTLNAFLSASEGGYKIYNYEIVDKKEEEQKQNTQKKERFRIEIRTTEEKKKAISEFAKENNTTVSKILNDLIDLIIQ